MQDIMERRGMRLVTGLALLLCIATTTYAQDSDESAAWGNDQATGDDGDVQWGQAGGDLFIATREMVTLGPAGCPVIVVGSEVWDVEAATPRDFRLDLESLPNNTKRALNAEGTLFAAVTASKYNEPTSLAVWSAQSGEKLSQFIFPGPMVEYIGLAGEDKLVLVCRDEKIYIYDPQTGKPSGNIDLPDRPYQNLVDIMSNGRYMAVGTTQATMVINIGNGRRVATMRSPPDEPRQAGARPTAQQGRSRRVPARAGGATINANMSLRARAVSFSPDGRELVCAAQHGSFLRIVVWNTRGTVVTDKIIRSVGQTDFVDHIAWLSDGKGWLVDGRYLIDRETGLVLVDLGRGNTGRFLDRERLLLEHSNNSVSVVRIPWETIDATLAAYKRKDEALLGAGTGAAASIDIIDARGNADQTQARLMQAIHDRFEQSDIELQDTAPVTLHIRMAEEAGGELKIYESASPFDFFGKDTGRTATEAKATLVAQMWIAGESEPIWTTQTRRGSSRRYDVDINNASVRDSMIESVERWIKGLPLPSYIPGDPDLAMLPVYMD